MRRTALIAHLALASVALPEVAHSQAAAAPAVQPFFSSRLRVESWDWFGGGAEGQYNYLGTMTRFGLAKRGTLSWRVELEAPALLGLPSDAARPAPLGQLGPGAGYYIANDSATSAVGLFPRQVFLRYGSAQGTPGAAIRFGRFEFSDGTERVPSQPTLATLRATRMAQRLIAPFGFSHVQRTLDGAHFTYDMKKGNFTLTAFRPTQGVFTVDGWSSLDMPTAYAAWSGDVQAGESRGDWRVFGILTSDRRSVVKTDNRPAAVRAADTDHVTVGSLGAHWIHVVPSRAGDVDVLAWGVWQTGTWGVQDHTASAVALEAGLQPRSFTWKPWLRGGWFHSSGDRNATDSKHGTFFQVLPTPRIFARTPFYNLMNSDEAFVSLQLRPSPKVSSRVGFNSLRLSSRRDLWYLGGGAFDNTSFGFQGRPSNGSRHLARVVDANIEWRPNSHVALELYASAVTGGNVIRNIYPGSASGRLVFVETTLTK